eukprot:1649365-Prymnesium_polylepis.2
MVYSPSPTTEPVSMGKRYEQSAGRRRRAAEVALLQRLANWMIAVGTWHYVWAFESAWPPPPE